MWWGSKSFRKTGTLKHPPPLPNRRLLSASSIALAALGALGLLFLASVPEVEKTVPTSGQQLKYTAAVPAPKSEEVAYQEKLEKELTAMLTQMTGAGNVQVFLTLVSGSTREFAEDVNESRQVTEEVDKQGGTRTTTSVQTDGQIVTVRSVDGGEVPVVRVEHKPKVQGVLVLAEGADDAQVRWQITKAVSTVLGIAEYRVTVLTKRR